MPARPRPAFRLEPLASRHDRTGFSCGAPELDDYLRRLASQDQRRKVAVCHVAVLPEAPARILGYYTLSTYSIRLRALPPEIARRLPRYPDLPAALIGRLAVDRSVQGQRLGELLLVDALQRTVRLAEELGVVVMVVDAKNSAATEFYARFGFQSFPSEPLRMFIPLATVARAFSKD
jgi:predicted GNAT family N-acyltransferase